MLNATLVRRIDVTPELVQFFVKPDSGVEPFLPGQYVAIGLPGSAPRYAGALPEKEPLAPDKIVKRAYSIGSSPEQRDALEFYIAIVPDGALTSRLACLRPGDRVFLAPKITGTFTLDPVPPQADLVLISTGTGLAPFMSMLRTPSVWSEGRSIRLLHGVRYPQDLAYRDELESFQASHKNFSYFPVVSRGGAEWRGAAGHVQSLIENGTCPVDPARDHVFLCGNPAMIDSVEALLLGRGYTVHSKKVHGNLHLERYW